MSYPFYDLYSREQNKGEILSKFLVYEVEHITNKGRMCAILISFSQLGFMGSKMQWKTTVCDKYDEYKRTSFRRRSLQPSIFLTILLFIRNRQSNWYFVYHHLLLTYNVDVRISTEHNQYGSNWWAVWLTTPPRGQCGSIRYWCSKYTEQRNSIRATPESSLSSTGV